MIDIYDLFNPSYIIDLVLIDFMYIGILVIMLLSYI